MEKGGDKRGGGVEEVGEICTRCVVLGGVVMAEEGIMRKMREP